MWLNDRIVCESWGSVLSSCHVLKVYHNCAVSVSENVVSAIGLESNLLVFVLVYGQNFTVSALCLVLLSLYYVD